MANRSDLTRRGQVLKYLEAHGDQWVDGTELANERVGGSEGLKRVRELRQEGHRIKTRPHPDPERSIFQYKLLTKEPNDALAPVVQEMWGEAARAPSGVSVREHPIPTSSPEPQPSLTPQGPMPMLRNEAGEFILTFEVCVECGGPYTDDEAHRMSDPKHLRWLEQQRVMVREHMDEPDQALEQATVPVPPQPPAFKYTEMPKTLNMDTSMVCPRCHGIRRSARKSRKRESLGELQEAEEFTRDPFKPTIKGQPNLCPRCNGIGVVPTFVRMDDEVPKVPPGAVRADSSS